MKKIIAVAAALCLALTATLSLTGIVFSTKGADAAVLTNLSGEDSGEGSGEVDLGGVTDLLGGIDLGDSLPDLGGVTDMLGGLDLGGITDMLGGFDLGGMLGGLGGDFDIGSIVDTVSGLVGGSSSSEDTTATPTTQAPPAETTTQAPPADTTAPSNVNTGD